MTYDTISPPRQRFDSVAGEPEPASAAPQPPRRIVVHPLAPMLGWPGVALCAVAWPRPPRPRFLSRRGSAR